MNVLGLHHVSVLVGDTAQALAFYNGLLGMEIDTARPDLGFPGAWLRAGQAQIHLLELPNPDPVAGRAEHGGRDRHVALLVRDLTVVQAALERADVRYTVSRSGRKAVFCRDPDGNGVELIEGT